MSCNIPGYNTSSALTGYEFFSRGERNSFPKNDFPMAFFPVYDISIGKSYNIFRSGNMLTISLKILATFVGRNGQAVLYY